MPLCQPTPRRLGSAGRVAPREAAVDLVLACLSLPAYRPGAIIQGSVEACSIQEQAGEGTVSRGSESRALHLSQVATLTSMSFTRSHSQSLSKNTVCQKLRHRAIAVSRADPLDVVQWRVVRSRRWPHRRRVR